MRTSRTGLQNISGKQKSGSGPENTNMGTQIRNLIYININRKNRIDVAMDDFEIIDRGFPNTVKRKVAQTLYIKELNPELNEQVKSA